MIPYTIPDDNVYPIPRCTQHYMQKLHCNITTLCRSFGPVCVIYIVLTNAQHEALEGNVAQQNGLVPGTLMWS